MIDAVHSIEEKEQEIVEEFLCLMTGWISTSTFIGLGKELPLIDESLKTEDLLIKGCQSRVWLHASLDGDKVIFTADSDAIITKGIISLLVRVLSGQSTETIINSDMSFVNEIGLKRTSFRLQDQTDW